jgi:hypothetical protein
VSNVQSLTVGIENGEGLVYVDDIVLYRNAPAPPSQGTDPGSTGLVASYHMENNLQDSSGNGLNGTAVGAPGFATSYGSLGMALSLAGADCVDLGNQAAFNPTGSFSVSLWANAETWDTDWNHVMIGNRGEDNIGWQIRRYAGTPNIAFTTRGVDSDDTQSTHVMPDNQWVHIACVYDSVANTKQIYVSGTLSQEVTTDPNTPTITATTHNTYIGARANSANDGQEAFFTGLLDEILVYNRALSEAEVRYLAGNQ